MKKIISLFLALMLLLGCVQIAAAEETELAVGVLSMLNMTEEQYLAYSEGRVLAMKYLSKKGAYLSDRDLFLRPKPPTRAVFYDRLTDLTMALESGAIGNARLPQSTAAYVCAHNDKLKQRGTFSLQDADDITKLVAYRLGVSFSFLLLEDRAALRDEIDQALTSMKEDGTLAALVQACILDAADKDPEPLEFPQTDGETIKVAITGELPPMDYVAPDGTPAGFNAALLAELGARMNKNFELVQVGSSGRSLALSEGLVDMVFWTNGLDERLESSRMTAEEHAEFMKDKPEEIRELMESISGGLDYDQEKFMDIPQGTIMTQPFFSDLVVSVGLKE